MRKTALLALAVVLALGCRRHVTPSALDAGVSTTTSSAKASPKYAERVAALLRDPVAAGAKHVTDEARPIAYALYGVDDGGDFQDLYVGVSKSDAKAAGARFFMSNPDARDFAEASHQNSPLRCTRPPFTEEHLIGGPLDSTVLVHNTITRVTVVMTVEWWSTCASSGKLLIP